jgi:hypothetical protein
MEQEMQKQCFNEARIYIINRFKTMSIDEYNDLCYGDGLLTVADEAMTKFNVEFEDIEQTFNAYSKPHMQFHHYFLNVSQLHDTTRQLHETICQFRHEPDYVHFDKPMEHLIGKLKFFIDLYANVNNILLYDNPDHADNYYTLLVSMFPEYTEDDFSDLCNDYFDYITNLIDSVIEVFENDGWIDIDEVNAHLDGLDEINFQEQQLIMDCYISKISNYKIMRRVDGKLVDEADYHDCLKKAAINDYRREHCCEEDDLLVQEF